MKICLDPGHGGADPGAVNGGRYEKHDVLLLALAMKPLLEARGIEVVMTRANDDNVPTINQRCALANSEKCAYYLSLQRDAAGPAAFGIGLWVYSKAGQPTINKAQTVLDALLAVTPTQNRRVNKGTPQSYPDFGVNA